MKKLKISNDISLPQDAVTMTHAFWRARLRYVEKALGSFDPLPTGADLATYWLNELGGGASRILRVLLDAYPERLDNATIGERANISSESGTFSMYMSKLRGLELITGARGATVASEELIS